ncbi:MAG TPA: hypothetical protein QF353_06220 [Gammaproteobacteria bacterium]|nr:hypothetical protein [Gammaproteobacteria bacterium]
MTRLSDVQKEALHGFIEELTEKAADNTFLSVTHMHYICDLLLADETEQESQAIYTKYLEWVLKDLSVGSSKHFSHYFRNFQNKYPVQAQIFWQKNFRKLIYMSDDKDDESVLKSYDKEGSKFFRIINRLDRLVVGENGQPYEDCFKALIFLTLHVPIDYGEFPNEINDRELGESLLDYFNDSLLRGNHLEPWITENEKGYSAFYFFLHSFEILHKHVGDKIINNIKERLGYKMVDVLSKPILDLSKYWNINYGYTPLMSMLLNCNQQVFEYVRDFHQRLEDQSIKIWDVNPSENISDCDFQNLTPFRYLVSNIKEKYDGLLPFIERVHGVLSQHGKAHLYWTEQASNRILFTVNKKSLKCALQIFLDSLDMNNLTKEKESLIFTLWKGRDSVLKRVMSDSFDKSSWSDNSRTRLNALKEWIQQQINLSQFGYHYAMFENLGLEPKPAAKQLKSSYDQKPSSITLSQKVIFIMGLFSIGHAARRKSTAMNLVLSGDTDGLKVFKCLNDVVDNVKTEHNQASKKTS